MFEKGKKIKKTVGEEYLFFSEWGKTVLFFLVLKVKVLPRGSLGKSEEVLMSRVAEKGVEKMRFRFD